MILWIILTLLLLFIEKWIIFSSMMNGLWISTDEFNKRSELSNMAIMVEGDVFHKHLLIAMYKDGANIFSNMYNLYIMPSIDPRCKTMKTIVYGDAEDIMRKTMMLEITTENVMIMQWGDTIYFEGLKM